MEAVNPTNINPKDIPENIEGERIQYVMMSANRIPRLTYPMIRNFF